VTQRCESGTNCVSDGRVTHPTSLDYVFSVEDERFDLIYPLEIRHMSWRHWTPVAVARQAAEFLVEEPGTSVLDVGCGPGKFCIVGALTSAGHFTGVEQRGHLADVARKTIERQGILNAEIVHTNITEVDFTAYDAFYLFNPFEENLFKRWRIDATVTLSRARYERYTEHVETELARAPIGTRVVTYGGICQEVPFSYECKRTSFGGVLKMWEKTRDFISDEAMREARAARSKLRFLRELRDAFG
jgi:tRNA A58 N-methylase Trm61